MLVGPTLALLLCLAPADEPLRAGLEVDAGTLGEGGEALAKRLQTRGQAVLREAEVLGPRGGDDPVIRVRVEALPGEAGYRCAYELRRGGEAIEGTQASTECRLCTDVELEDQVTKAIGRLVPKLDSGDGSARDPVPPPEAAPADVDRDPGGWMIGRMGRAGIGLSVVGAAALGVGLGLAISGPIVDAKGGALQTSGITMAVIGGAVLVSGVVLLAVDEGRSRRVAPTATGLRVRF